MKFPEFKQLIEDAWLAQDESIWLRLLSGDDSTARWVLLDAQGHPRGTPELPSHLRLRCHRGHTFCAAAHNGMSNIAAKREQARTSAPVQLSSLGLAC